MLPIVDPNRSYNFFGGDRSYANEMFEINRMSARHSFMEDGEVGDYGEGIFRHNIPARVTDYSSVIRNRRMNSERTETDLHRNCGRLFESRAESRDLYLENERMPPNSVSCSRGENGFTNCNNMFSSPDSVVSPNFTRDGMMRSELVSDHFLLDRRYGVNMNDDSYERYLVREREKNRNDKVLMRDKVLGLNHKDNYVGLGSLCEKFGTPLNEQRNSSVDNQMKAGYIDCLNRSNTLSLPSVVDDYRFNRSTRAVNEPGFGNVSGAGISPKYNAFGSQLNHGSSDCLNMLFSEVPFSACNRNYHTCDDIVCRSIPEPLSLHYGRPSLPMEVGQSANLLRDVNPHLSHRNIYSPHMETENRGYNSSECGSACIGSGKPKKSVFARLTSSSSSRLQAKDKDTIDIDSSVDELMEILRQSKKFRLKKLERINPAVQLQQHNEGEKKKKRTITSLGNCPGNSDLVSVPEKLLEESIKTIDGIVHETLTETRAVEFRRRREKSTCDKTQVCRDAKKENDKSAENAEPVTQQLHKEQPKRRKLVRPVFAVNN